MSEIGNYKSITSDGDFDFLINCFIPLNRRNFLFLEQLRAMWTALCFHHGVCDYNLTDDYYKGLHEIEQSVGRNDKEFERFMGELINCDDDEEEILP